MDDPGPDTTTEFTAGDGQTYADERRARRLRGRVLGFGVCIALWLLSAVPLARLSSDEGGGLDVAAVYLATGLGIAVVTRAIYARLKGRQFWSPWLFLTAAVLAIASYAIASAGEEVASPQVEAAVAGGSSDATAER